MGDGGGVFGRLADGGMDMEEDPGGNGGHGGCGGTYGHGSCELDLEEDLAKMAAVPTGRRRGAGEVLRVIGFPGHLYIPGLRSATWYMRPTKH